MTTLHVERAECQVLVEDLGRPGWAHLGVPHAGALDVRAMALANRLVANPEGWAGLEVLVGGLALVPVGSVRLALTGAQLSLCIAGRAAPWGTPVSVPAGVRIEVNPVPGALRGWLAVGGGIDVQAVLGSRSTDTFSGLGPPPIEAGAVLPVGEPRPATAGASSAVPSPMPDGPTVLRVRPGPRADWLTAASLRAMWGRPFEVAAASSRVAVRLRGEPLLRRVTRELASEGLVTGAVQVPADGQPLIFLADHPTTGGYPVVGVVHRDDLAVCAQLRPGDAVRFMPLR